MRSYDEYCAIAKSLDVVGDRWTLLIVRELALGGPRRYTDLRNGLPGIATNLLADRLRELEHAGVVEREDAPPPVATTLFHLTPRGEELRPLLEQLIRWGVPLMTEQKPSDAVRSSWLAWALEAMLTDAQPDAPSVTIEVRTGDQSIAIETRDGAIHTQLGAVTEADATLTGPPTPVLGVLFGLVPLAEAEGRADGITYEGDPTILDRFRSELSSGGGSGSRK
jgi:DNA-binding HxlR family transcriptional regulator